MRRAFRQKVHIRRTLVKACPRYVPLCTFYLARLCTTICVRTDGRTHSEHFQTALRMREKQQVFLHTPQWPTLGIAQPS